MFRQHNPLDAPAPFGAFSNGIEVPAGMRLLFVKGQIGAGRDGTVLRSAGMDAPARSGTSSSRRRGRPQPR
jgi:hypothetical protein